MFSDKWWRRGWTRYKTKTFHVSEKRWHSRNVHKSWVLWRSLAVRLGCVKWVRRATQPVYIPGTLWKLVAAEITERNDTEMIKQSLKEERSTLSKALTNDLQSCLRTNRSSYCLYLCLWFFIKSPPIWSPRIKNWFVPQAVGLCSTQYSILNILHVYFVLCTVHYM